MEFVRSRKGLTRVDHRCWGCGRKFPKGSTLLIVTSVDSGQISDTYWCEVCDTYFQEQDYHQDDAGDMGDVKAADPLYWEELRIKIEGATAEVVLDLLVTLYKATKDLVRMIPEQLLPDYQPALDSLEEVEANVLKVIPPEGEKECPTCGGGGRTQRVPYGAKELCETCGGTGEIPAHEAPAKEASAKT